MTELKRRKLGNTNLSLTELGLGGVFLSPSKSAQAETPVKLVQRALELGITFFDTAPVYAGGESQEVMGEALHDRQSETILATKCGCWPWEDAPYRQLDAYKSQLERTLQALHRESVDILFIHEADWLAYWEEGKIPRTPREIELTDQLDYASAPVTRFLAWAQEQGLARHIGISGNNAHLLTKVLREFSLRIDALLVAFQYSLLWRNAKAELLPTAKEMGVGVILGSPLHQGKLAVPHPEWLDSPPEWMNDDTRQRLRELYAVQAESGLTLAELALRFLLADPDFTSVIPGSSNIAHLEENVRYAQAGPLPPDIQTRLAAVGKVFPGLWGKDF